MKSICKKILGISATFRDESNDGNYLMIGYSNATVTIIKSRGQRPH